MRDEESQRRCEAFDLGGPIREQRGGRHQQARGSRRRRRPLRRRFVLENQEQRQYLDGFAQSHVVRETGAKPEAVQQVEPTDTGLLIGAQRRLKRRTRLDAGESVGAAQALESLREPGSGAHRRPVGIRRVARLLLFYRDAGHQPHGIGERQSAVGRCRFDLAESVEELLELRPDPPRPSVRAGIAVRRTL